MERRPERRERGARILVGVYGAATVTTIAMWLVEHWDRRAPNWPELLFTLFNVPVAHSLVSVVVLALMTRALLTRKRIALWAVAFTQVFGMYLGIAVLANLPTSPFLRSWRHQHVLYLALDVASLPIGAAVLAVLWWMRDAFPARLRPGSWVKALAVAGLGAGITVGLTVLIVDAVTGLSPAGRDRMVLAVLSRAIGDTGEENLEKLGTLPVWVPQVASLLVSLTLLLSVWVFTSSVRSPTSWSADRELRLRKLILQSGSNDSLAYFATRRDKASIFSADGRAAVTYRVLRGVSLASGDPIGDPTAWPRAVQTWLAEARRYGWMPAVIGASEAGARAFVDAGLKVITLGDEAILEREQFSLARATMAPLRQAVKRTRKEGVTVRFRRQWELDPAELAEIVAAANTWRQGADRGFSMALNRLGDPADREILFVTAHRLDQLVAVLTFVPWGRRDLSLDVMRRAPNAPNGVTERMVCDLLTAPELRIRRVSLNFCMFRQVYAQAADLGAGALTRFNHSLLGWLDRLWQLERLYRATQRYQPQWQPRFVCFDDLVGLPLVAIAAGTAEGFLPVVDLPGSGRHPTLTPEELQAVVDQDRDWRAAALPAPRRGDQFVTRLRHRDALAAVGIDPYPAAEFRPDHTVAEVAGSAPDGRAVRVAGRVSRIRDHGGVVFAALHQEATTVQLVLDSRRLGRESVRRFAHLVDLGDLLGVDGRWAHSLTGSASVLADTWSMQAKCLHPLPFSGLADPEARLRRRSVDLIVNQGGLAKLGERSAVVRALRDSLSAAGFAEVETPMLQTVHGGASARPFRTHSNAYDVDLSLRIAPELYLKRLVVAGMGAVFEIGRNFRNEGADATHNPEFTAVEAYRPFADYHDMSLLTMQIIRAAARAVHGRAVVSDGADGWIDLDRDWPVVPMLDALSDALGRRVDLTTDMDVLLEAARRHGVPISGQMGPGAVLEELYTELVEPRTIEPTFYVDFPQETSPLTRPHRTKPGLVERWDLVVRGLELGTAYTELTDPLDQRERFTLQSLKAAAGDPEAMEVDQEFLATLEVGMPPTGGLGLGVDRLAMIVTGASLRSVLTFPFVRPR